MAASSASQKDEKVAASTLSRSRDFLCGIGCYPLSLQKFATLPYFIFFYSMAGLMTQTLTSYLSSQITAIEKQFGLSSKQSGFILICNDIGFVVVVLFTSHFLAKGTIPIYLGLLTFLFGVSGLVCALPHIMLGVKDYKGGTNTGVTGTMLCTQGRNETISGDTDCNGAEMGSYSNTAFAIIATGMMLQGMAKSPRLPLVTTYVDNNFLDKTRTGFLLGIITAVGVLGPALAMGLGSVFSSIYVTLEDVAIDAKNPEWVGAWWLGFIVFGIVAMFISIPVACFPKQMPTVKDRYSTEEKTLTAEEKPTSDTKPAEKTSGEDEKCEERGKRASIKDFLKILRRLSMNPVFVLIILSTAIKMLAIGGQMGYGPKYLEVQFMETAWRANLIFGGSRLVDAFVGTLVGGYLSTRLKLTRTGNVKLVLIASVVSCVAAGFILMIGCDQPRIKDFDRIRSEAATMKLEKRSAIDICDNDCGCHKSQFHPVCSDSRDSFYSPCYAGCKNTTGQQYSECSCVGGNGTAVAGACDTGCTKIIPFSIVTFIFACSFTMQLVPTYMAVIRSVEEEEKPVALGISTMLNTLIGLLPGPVIYGVIFDNSCLVWRESCNQRGSCALYDLEQLRIFYQSSTFGLNILALIAILIAFVIALKLERKSVKLTETTSDLELEIKF